MIHLESIEHEYKDLKVSDLQAHVRLAQFGVVP